MSEILRSLSASAGQLAQGAARYLPEPLARGVDFAGSLAVAGSGGSTTEIGLSPSYEALLNRQIETQAELQQVTFISNIERSQHEIRMSPVRNIRVA